MTAVSEYLAILVFFFISENHPIILELFLILLATYYSGIFCLSLLPAIKGELTCQ